MYLRQLNRVVSLLFLAILNIFILTNHQSSETLSAEAVTNFSELTPYTTPQLGSSQTEVGKWRRFEIAYANPSWGGNPFDLDFQATFTHTASGRSVTQLGFYAGNNVWKLFFMPDELGEWTFVTDSSDPELNNKAGAFNCVPSNLPGQLVAGGNRWQLEETNKFIAPIMIPTREWFKQTNTSDGIDDFLLWTNSTVGAHVVGTTLVYFKHPQAAVPYIKGQEGDAFNIAMWDRLNSHYDMLRDMGMGFYIMFYSDDSESPNLYGITAQSEEELRLFRYAVARFSAYPIVMWDTGIDIGETRSDAWIDWFAEWFNDNDPWQHPVSSRTGGGSGGKFPLEGSYYSDGSATLPAHSQVVASWQSLSVPLAYTDRWRENGTRGNFDRDKIRRAVWEVGLVGGTAVYIGANENDGYLKETYATDFEAAPDIGFRSDFFCYSIQDFGNLNPHGELIVSGTGAVLAANPGYEYVVYDYDGGAIGINLEDASGISLQTVWYNPRTGQFFSDQTIVGGGSHSFVPPFSSDFVLHLYQTNSSSSGQQQLFGSGANSVFLPLVLNNTGSILCSG
ncbi:MAG: DUF5060 domain-containing protein [Ardenticatenaceae bacterium]|nr:DUF5060 domain-containing protein [Ardenticatenaceae bacterium]